MIGQSIFRHCVHEHVATHLHGRPMPPRWSHSDYRVSKRAVREWTWQNAVFVNVPTTYRVLWCWETTAFATSRKFPAGAALGC